MSGIEGETKREAIPPATAPSGPRAPEPEPEQLKRETRKALLGGSVGNFIEQFDFGIYGYMAPYLAASFFPSHDPVASLLSVYLVYGLSFFIRPLGGILFGRFGDRLGRRSTLAWSLILMGLGTAAVGLLPTHGSVGLLAPMLLVLLRVIQGLSQGGEFPGAVSFIVEYAPAGRRGRYTSALSSSTFVGLLAGSGVAALVSGLLGDQTMTGGGWRIPFLIALPLTVVGLLLRMRIRETPEFEALTSRRRGGDERAKAPFSETVRTQWKPILVYAGCALAPATIAPTFIAFIPSYLKRNLGLSGSQALLTGTISLAVVALMVFPVGRLTDRFGRKPLFAWGCGLAIVLMPFSVLLMHNHGFAILLLGQLLFMVPIWLTNVSLNVTLAEMFPTRLRYSASALAYNLPFAIFAGSAPLVSGSLLSSTGTIWSVVGYLSGLAVISTVCVVWGLRETYRSELRKGAGHSVSPGEIHR
ncbi:MFS transporter [Amycolatopsis pithecellobii]|uniref:Putative proline/betaine transporter n=1 Tax=Amycolatopsis pithecellobii TaxID=664692 RepID=A0A6N7YJR5_9PSEU|nr:MFS transporter [Amycolatopsis pithecellobii]MTD53137.1 MFS transporter [Amycolatopsis pithecellobii]